MKKCDCGRFRHGQPFDPTLDCPKCWLWHNRPEYRDKMAGEGKRAKPCRFLGRRARDGDKIKTRICRAPG